MHLDGVCPDCGECFTRLEENILAALAKHYWPRTKEKAAQFHHRLPSLQAKLSVVQSDLADEKTKTVALTKERDGALRVTKGGTAWRRVTRAAKWFLLGAAASAVASKAR